MVDAMEATVDDDLGQVDVDVGDVDDVFDNQEINDETGSGYDEEADDDPK